MIVERKTKKGLHKKGDKYAVEIKGNYSISVKDFLHLMRKFYS